MANPCSLSHADGMPGGFAFDKFTDVIETLGLGGEPIEGSFGGQKCRAFDAASGSLLQFFALSLGGYGGDAAQVIVRGEGGDEVFAFTGENVDDATGKIAGGEHFS